MRLIIRCESNLTLGIQRPWLHFHVRFTVIYFLRYTCYFISFFWIKGGICLLLIKGPFSFSINQYYLRLIKTGSRPQFPVIVNPFHNPKFHFKTNYLCNRFERMPIYFWWSSLWSWHFRGLAWIREEMGDMALTVLWYLRLLSQIKTNVCCVTQWSKNTSRTKRSDWGLHCWEHLL